MYNSIGNYVYTAIYLLKLNFEEVIRADCMARLPRDLGHPQARVTRPKLAAEMASFLPCTCFLLKRMRIRFISKVARADKAAIVANDASLFFSILGLFREFHAGKKRYA